MAEPSKGGAHASGSVTLPASVTTYVGASITVSPSYHGYGTIRKLSLSAPKLAAAKVVSGGRNIQIIGKRRAAPACR